MTLKAGTNDQQAIKEKGPVGVRATGISGITRLPPVNQTHDTEKVGK